MGVNLAKRIARENSGNDYGRALERISGEIEEDREALKELMGRMGVRQHPLKVGIAAVGERLGRLKPNDSLISYSPLSRLIELEALTLGVMGKLELWRTLADIADAEKRLERRRLEDLARRAEGQRDELQRLRQRAANEALT